MSQPACQPQQVDIDMGANNEDPRNVSQLGDPPNFSDSSITGTLPPIEIGAVDIEFLQADGAPDESSHMEALTAGGKP